MCLWIYLRPACFALLAMLMFALPATAQQESGQYESMMSGYLESIRHQPVMLRHFFQQMPKGGDLHHHYSGSVYAETYLEAAEKHDFWVNRQSLSIKKEITGREVQSEWIQISQLRKNGEWPAVRLKLLRKWSVLYFNREAGVPGDVHFFSTFGGFALSKSHSFRDGMLELRNRALYENVSYIETIYAGIDLSEVVWDFIFWDSILLERFPRFGQDDLFKVLDEMYLLVADIPAFEQAVAGHNDSIRTRHYRYNIDTAGFVMRYQNYVLRTAGPASVFLQMAAGFRSAHQSDLVVGINIVAPEHHEVSMRDYRLHMRMFRYFQYRYPDVPVAAHAGELVLGMVKPEQLSGHIEEAIITAGARRIGHGVSIAHEASVNELLTYMRQNGIAVEINLSSNAFILGVSGYHHPVVLYHSAGVPMVICTDDAGVLRDDLTEQFVTLVHDYSSFTYTDVKALVYNSITYSFLPEADKDLLREKLNMDFAIFEEKMAQMIMSR